LLLSRVTHMEIMEDEKFLEERTENFDDYYNFFRSYKMKDMMKRCGVNLNHIGDILYRVKGKKTVILVGTGVQKYSIGSSVLRAIDSFGAMLGLFGKKGSGVSYLADSSFEFAKPFDVKAKRIPKPEVDFRKFDFIFVQGANPATQAPNSKAVKEGLEKNFSVYFGLFENETSKRCDLVLPAKNFLEKNDVKISYGHEYVLPMPKLKESDIGISEYDLTAYLVDKFGFEKLKSEEKYIKEIIDSNTVKEGDYLKAKTHDKLPYEDGFYTDSGKFVFIDELDDEEEEFYYEEMDDTDFFLITAKHKGSLNSQFGVDEYLYIPPLLGFKDGDKVEVVTDAGSEVFEIRVSDRLRGDTLLLYSSNPKANHLIDAISSDEGENAVFNTTARIKKVD
ncbi:MAG: molybdopterin-dependent oxidoreductase, partial [Epsilonproteobacteria bacterium]|nr:molybdopterin-dependent oxidoreductase [Campylobacterota bacterium]